MVGFLSLIHEAEYKLRRVNIINVFFEINTNVIKTENSKKYHSQSTT